MRNRLHQLSGACLALAFVLLLSATARAQYTETVLYNFCSSAGECIDGSYPGYAGLIADAQGNLYGTTAGGGANNGGIVFELSPPSSGAGSWTETVLYNFCSQMSCADGANPYSGVIFDSQGNLYGTAAGGGTFQSYGVVFELSPPAGGNGPWTYTLLYTFGGGNDGQNPYGGVIFDAQQKNLYGTTFQGGAANEGTVFELSPPNGGTGPWTENLLHAFGGENDGVYANGGVTFDSQGNLYGTTIDGPGSAYNGTVFELSPPGGGTGPWTETILYDGNNSFFERGVVFDGQGNLYTTGEGAGIGYGGVVELNPPSSGATWNETDIFDFPGFGPNGADPFAGLTFDSQGNLYGTTTLGGNTSACPVDAGCGVVYALSPAASGGSWTEHVLYSFSNTDGAYPYSGLLADSHGNFYGTTSQGGAHGLGVVYAISAPVSNTLVSSSQNPSVYGESVYFTATVTPNQASLAAPTGTVQFQIDGVNFGSPVALSGGQAVSEMITTLTVAGHAIAVIYSGDFYNRPSTGNLAQTVNDASASVGITLTNGMSPSTYGTSLTFTATLTGQYGQVTKRSKGARPQIVTGSVTWSANTGCGATPTTAGAATCTTSVLPGGSDTVTATYGGDGSHTGSNGSVGQTVNPQTPVVTVTNLYPASEGYGAGTPVAVTATLTWNGSGNVPSGTISFNSNAGGSFAGSPSCSVINSTTVTCSQTFNPATADAVGTYTISASYASDGNYSSAGSTQTNNFSIQDASTSVGVALTTGSNPSTYGTSVTFTATVAGQYGQVTKRTKGAHSQIVTGSVTWSADTGCGATAVTAGVATCTTSVLPGGADTVTATYGGDSDHNGGSGSVGQTVNLLTPVVTVTSVSPASEGYGAGTPTVVSATLTWTGSGAAPTGGLTFKSTAAGSFAGSPSCSPTNTTTIACTQSFTPAATDAVGTYTISANYTSNGNYNPVGSTQTNNFSILGYKVTPAVNITVVFPNAEPYGASLGAAVTATLSWTGAGPAPTAAGGALLSFTSSAPGSFEPVVCLGKTSPIVCGTLFLPVVNDGAGAYTIRASYAGNSNYNAASSPQTNNFTITADAPAVKVTPNPVTVVHGATAPVVLTAAFTGAGSSDAAPTGTVTFSAATGTFSGQSCASSKDVLTCTVSYKPSGTLAASTYNNYLAASIVATGDYKAASGYATLSVTK